MIKMNLSDYMFDKIYFTTSWNLVKYPDEIVEAVRNMIQNGQDLAPDPLTMLSLELGYLTEQQLMEGDYKLSTSSMIDSIFGNHSQRYTVSTKHFMINELQPQSNNEVFRNDISVNVLAKELWGMICGDNMEFMTKGMLDWNKVLHQMLWVNYQIDLSIKLVMRIQNDYPDTLKEATKTNEYKGCMMEIFRDSYTLAEDQKVKSGNYWLDPNKVKFNFIKSTLNEVDNHDDF